MNDACRQFDPLIARTGRLSAEETAALDREVYELEQRAETDVAAIRAKWAAVAAAIEEAPVRLRPGDVTLDALEVVWVPRTRAL